MNLHLVTRSVFATLLACAFSITTGCGGSGGSNSNSNNVSIALNTTTTLTSSAATVAGGVNVMLTAVVTPNPAGGTVYFYDNNVAIGSQGMASGTGTAVFVTYFTTAGLHSITATFAQQLFYNSSTSSSVPITVTSAAPSSPVTAAGGANFVYVIQNPSTGVSQILKFPVAGSTTPTSTLNLPSGFVASAVGLDGFGKIYVGGSQAGSPIILLYSPGTSGTATPLQTIAKTSGTSPFAMYVTPYGGIYTADKSGVVWTYGTTSLAGGTTSQVITGTSTGLGLSLDITVDSYGVIYVSTQVISGTLSTGAILVFGSTANGNEAPIRTITSPNLFYGIATDISSNLYAVVDNTITNTASIAKYAPLATGAATPTNTIAGTATMLGIGGGIKVDSVGNLYVADVITSGSSSTFIIEEYGPLASGNQAPGVSFTSTAITATASQPGIAISQ